MEVVQSQHSVYRLSYHVVWVCKYRRRVLKPGVVDYIKKLLPKLLRSIPGCEIEKIGFDKDHVHFVMTIPPRYAIAYGTTEKPIFITNKSQVYLAQQSIF